MIKSLFRDPKIFSAISEDDHDTVSKIILSKPKFRTYRNKDGNMPIHHLCWQKKCNLKIAKILLDEESDSYLDKFGNSPLNVACQNNRDDLIKLFIQNGHSFNRPDHNGNTVLHYLYFKNYDPEVIKKLIANGADIDAKNNRGYKPNELRIIDNEENTKDNYLTYRVFNAELKLPKIGKSQVNLTTKSNRIL